MIESLQFPAPDSRPGSQLQRLADQCSLLPHRISSTEIYVSALVVAMPERSSPDIDTSSGYPPIQSPGCYLLALRDSAGNDACQPRSGLLQLVFPVPRHTRQSRGCRKLQSWTSELSRQFC